MATTCTRDTPRGTLCTSSSRDAIIAGAIGVILLAATATLAFSAMWDGGPAWVEYIGVPPASIQHGALPVWELPWAKMNGTSVAVPPFWHEYKQFNLYMYRYNSFFETVPITGWVNDSCWRGSKVTWIIWAPDQSFYFNDETVHMWLPTYALQLHDLPFLVACSYSFGCHEYWGNIF